MNKKFLSSVYSIFGDFPVVQWLRLQAPNAVLFWELDLTCCS